MLCQYKDILGVPNQGVHSYRIFDIAIADVILLVLFAWLVQVVVSLFTPMSYPLALLLSFITGIILHRMFCVRTTLDKILFP